MKPPTEPDLATPGSPRPPSSGTFPLGVVAVLALASALAWWFRPNQPLREGVLWAVSWAEDANHGGFLTRGQSAFRVPGGNGGGLTDVDMTGRLFPSHLEITYLSAGHPVIQVIPMARLVTVEFGDRGVKKANRDAAVTSSR